MSPAVSTATYVLVEEDYEDASLILTGRGCVNLWPDEAIVLDSLRFLGLDQIK